MYEDQLRCPSCAEGISKGNGKCARCNGTGINPQLHSDEPKCPACNGTGTCATCGGAGTWPPPEPKGLQKLFE